jgi:Flp pilus assembly protein TadG
VVTQQPGPAALAVVEPGRHEPRARDERGSTIAETVIVAPAVFLLIMTVVQVALVAHARNVAEAAAQDGVATARRFDGSASDGSATATAALGALGPRMLTDRRVSVDRSPTTAAVTITGRVISLTPGLDLTITATASGPVERYVPPGTDH